MDRARPAELALDKHACTACHSLDGTPAAGPSFAGLYLSQRLVIENGKRTQVRADDDYLLRAITEPDVQIVVGYQPGSMPKQELSEHELQEVLTALRQVPASASSAAPTPAAAEGSSALLLGGMIAFVALHFLLSAVPLRRTLQMRLGEGPFMGVYSLVALATLTTAIWGYSVAPYIQLWPTPLWTRWVPALLMPLALLLTVAAFSTPSPTLAGAADKAIQPRGIVRVTRHPFLWGTAIWAVSHLIANGDYRSAVLAGGMLVLSIGGMFHIDQRRAASSPEWPAFAQKTSLLPFGAIAAGRNTLQLSEIGWSRVAVALVAYGVLLTFHSALFGKPAWPY